jgi:hypothetical protein
VALLNFVIRGRPEFAGPRGQERACGQADRLERLRAGGGRVGNHADLVRAQMEHELRGSGGLADKVLEAFDAETNLLVHFPCSIAQRVEKRPVGELHVAAIAPNPNYTFDPEVFPESPEAQQIKTKLIIPPGPNNPVGTVWISLDKPGYGIHGTPGPEQVGRTESHGCFRLANWNAERLLSLVWVGLPVYIEP